ncbi:MAG: long-chain fatty acid--CoA ligase [Pirellulales bacterium]|nr:long-chain fatty acid--CoA ligase [Pirellulales bacterium]
MKLHEYLLSHAERTPDRIFLEFMGMQIPFFVVATQAKQVCQGLRNVGIQAGESVGVMLPNIPPFVSSYFGTLMNGSVVVTMNVLLQKNEIQYLIQDSNIRVIIVFEMFLQQVHDAVSEMENPPLVFVVGEDPGSHRPYHDLMPAIDESFQPTDVDPSLPIMTLYTSGTTGKPKGAQLTAANVEANLDMLESLLPVETNDKWLCVLPLFHVFALNGILNASVRHGTCVVLHPRFEVEGCFKSLVEDGITSFAGVPTMYFYLLKHPQVGKAKFPALRYCISGGAAMPVEVLNQWEKTVEAPIYEGFGMTETTVSVSINLPDARKVGSIGRPFKGVDMRIFDEQDVEVADGTVGELVIRAPNIMKGYLNKPAETAEAMRNGWFHTGDMGYRDADGFYYIVDRKKDMIIKGGFNIYPREIEEAIYELPEVAEAAVIGVFDEAKGELVKAIIACKPGMSLSPAGVDAHLRARLAKYKLPQEYEFLPELPKGPTGKILKRELRDASQQWNRDHTQTKLASEKSTATASAT